MELDFSGIRNNRPERPRNDFKGLSEESIGHGDKSPQNAPECATEGIDKTGQLAIRYNREKEDQERIKEVYRAYQANTKTAGLLSTEILKGIKTGEKPVLLLLKAMKCISLMTSDTMYYEQAEKDIKSIYGMGLLEPEPLELELQDTKERLRRLKLSLKRDTEPEDSKKRIKSAIEAHRKRIEQIEKLIM